VDGQKYYYIVNHTSADVDTAVYLNAVGKSVLLMDPQIGTFGVAPSAIENEKTKVRIQLKSGEATILKVSDVNLLDIAKWKYIEPTGRPILLSGKWNLKFTQGGPEIPDEQMLTTLISWTELKDKKGESFSGTAVYTTTFNIPNKQAAEYVLDLGKVGESARVWINGNDAGIFWSFPYNARVGKYLKKGKNTIKIEVANLMANRIRDMDQKGIEWRNYHEINFVNINYKPFDAKNWLPMPSGLLEPVKIIPYENDK
jgi:hypothetical protein